MAGIIRSIYCAVRQAGAVELFPCNSLVYWKGCILGGTCKHTHGFRSCKGFHLALNDLFIEVLI